MRPNAYFGTIFYSGYFGSRGVVVRYKNDDDWYFVIEKQPMRVLKAQTKLSKLKTIRNEDKNE